MGAAALLVASGCPPGHSPSHIGLDPVWAQAQEAGIPVVFHVGGTGDLIDPAYFRNGLPVPPDFHGGEENFRSVDYMGIPGPPAQTLATMIFDGVLERFGDLRIGVIEQGAIWVPSWTRQMESAFEAFARHEERLRALSLRPTEYVRRQVRFTPYPTEDVGWIISQSGPEVCLFSSDYPHVEGGRRPARALRGVAGGDDDRGPRALLHDQLPRPHGLGRRRAGRLSRLGPGPYRFGRQLPPVRSGRSRPGPEPAPRRPRRGSGPASRRADRAPGMALGHRLDRVAGPGRAVAAAEHQGRHLDGRPSAVRRHLLVAADGQVVGQGVGQLRQLVPDRGRTRMRGGPAPVRS